MRHRGDIDGLRAVAVVPVVLFHLGLAGIVPGGFVGVDIFFVISGYLITRILLEDIDAGRYSLAGFYRRRVLRIFPALFVMYAACLALSFSLDYPGEFADVAKSVLSSIFFVSNLFFHARSGYFDPLAENSPLLHTWSLSVEEQFYVLFPPLLLALAVLKRRGEGLVLGALALASFAASVWMVGRNPDAAFYMVQYRAWELMIGALLALGMVPALNGRWPAELAALAGLALIAGSIGMLDEHSAFPGLGALAPCLGAAAILHAGATRTTLVGRLLSLAPLRFVGLISYSLYLWHWPVIVFYKQSHPLTASAAALLLLLSLGLAVLSWRFVEQPFRAMRAVPSARIVSAGAASMVAAAALCLVAIPANRMIHDIPERAEKLLTFSEPERREQLRVDRCFLTSASRGLADFDEAGCLPYREGTRNILVLGDSHAAHLWPGLVAVPGVNWLQANSSGCKPIIGSVGERRCTELMDYVLKEFIPARPIDGIVLSARWVEGDIEGVERTVAYLRGRVPAIAVSGPIVEYDAPLPQLLAKAIIDGDPSIPPAHRRSEPAAVDRQLAAALSEDAVTYISMYDTVCNPDCALWADRDTPMQFDYGHLTVKGSRLVAEAIAPRILAAAASRTAALASRFPCEAAVPADRRVGPGRSCPGTPTGTPTP